MWYTTKHFRMLGIHRPRHSYCGQGVLEYLLIVVVILVGLLGSIKSFRQGVFRHFGHASHSVIAASGRL